MTVVIRLVCLADGNDFAGEGKYLQWWNLDANHGRGQVRVTADVRRAFKFPDPGDAMRVWRATSPGHPVRETDGKPNRPLTAFRVEILPYDENAVLQEPPEVELLEVEQ